MDEPLRAGEPMVPPRRRPPPSAAPEPPPARKPRRRRQEHQHWTVAAFHGLMRALVALVLAIGVAGAAGGWMLYQHFANGLPDVDGLRGYEPRVMSRVYASNGELLADLATERRIYVPINAIPPIVKQAFISAEDRNFYSHKGVDPLAVLRAAVTDLLRRDRRPIGASTITQQVAKNMLLDNEVTFARKAKEAILAFRIERTLTKNQILELYLNEIYLGLGAYGVAAASEAYFNKPLDQLTIPEAAFLAALPKAPNSYNPFRNPELARAQRARVLDRMAEDGILTHEQATEYKQEPIVPVAFQHPQVVTDADWFAEDVRRQLIAEFGQDNATQGGLQVRTSLDPALQAAANKALRDGLIAYDRRLGGWRGPVTHIDNPALESNWPALLAPVARTPGMLPSWRLAMVLTTTDSEARVGWLSDPDTRGATPVPKVGEIPMSDVTWARPAHGDDIGPTPKRMSDVMRPGDVVMIEPLPTAPPEPAAKPAHAGAKEPVVKVPPGLPKVTLRQIPAVQGALICMDPTTGRVLAMVGGFSYDQSQFNRASQAMRQPGSSFKPMVYLTALEQGIPPTQMISNSELSIQVGNTVYEPENDSGTFGAPVSMKTALQYSMNVPTIRLAQKVGMAAVAKTAQEFHMYDALPHVISAAIGSVETTPMREIGAYAGIDEGGKEVVPTLIDSVQDRHGRIVWRPHDLECEGCSDPKSPPTIVDMRTQIADPYADRTLIDLMENVVTAGTGTRAGAGFNRPIAGKTGTTQDWGDAWFSGFTPDLVTTVWVGKDNNTSLGRHEEGGFVAAPIWHQFMAEAFKGRPVLQFPPASGPRIAFAPPENRVAEGVIGSGAPRSATQGADSVHGGVDNKLGGLY